MVGRCGERRPKPRASLSHTHSFHHRRKAPHDARTQGGAGWGEGRLRNGTGPLLSSHTTSFLPLRLLSSFPPSDSGCRWFCGCRGRCCRRDPCPAGAKRPDTRTERGGSLRSVAHSGEVVVVVVGAVVLVGVAAPFTECGTCLSPSPVARGLSLSPCLWLILHTRSYASCLVQGLSV